MTSRADFEGSEFSKRDRRPDETGPPDSQPLSAECEKVQLAQRILGARRVRAEHLNAPIFSEPAWDMLLELYIRETSGASSTTAQLYSVQGAPSSTASRWLDVLESAGLIARRRILINGNSELIHLTSRGRTALDDYLTAVGDL